MNQYLNLTVVTQEKTILEAKALQVSLPAADGEITVLPHHRALTSTMKAGDVVIRHADGTEQLLVVSPGFIQIENNNLTVLADSAIREEDLDESAALAAKEAAEERIAQLQSESEIAMTLGAIERSLMELRAIRRGPRHKAGR